MSLYLQQKDNRSELQKRIAAELQDKAKKKPVEPHDLPDGVEDSAYVKDLESAGSGGWVWLLILAVAAVAAVIWLIFK